MAERESHCHPFKSESETVESNHALPVHEVGTDACRLGTELRSKGVEPIAFRHLFDTGTRFTVGLVGCSSYVSLLFDALYKLVKGGGLP